MFFVPKKKKKDMFFLPEIIYPLEMEKKKKKKMTSPNFFQVIGFIWLIAFYNFF